MPDKKTKTPKTPGKPYDEIDPETATKNKESARKLISILQEKIPDVQSPAKRVELSDLFVDIKCKCELEDSCAMDHVNGPPQQSRRRNRRGAIGPDREHQLTTGKKRGLGYNRK